MDLFRTSLVRWRSPKKTGLERALLAAVLFATHLPLHAAPIPLGERTEKLLVDAVAVAAELDLYHARCRRDVSGRRIDNLNKELVSKFRMTVLQVEDNLFPERSYRQARERLQREFLENLEQIGGCEAAKAAGMPNRLRERYYELMGRIERLP